LNAVKHYIWQNLSRRKKKKTSANVARPTVQDNLKPGDTPEGLELLSQGVTTFLECLNEFPEFMDDAQAQ
jgi:hypothetical protein